MEDDDDSRAHAFRLNVPITEEERSHSRDGSLDRLLDSRPASASHNSSLREESDTLPPQPVYQPDYRETPLHQHQENPGQPLYDPPIHPNHVFPVEEELRQQFSRPEEPIPRTRTGYAQLQRAPKLWRPFWLRELVLAAFVLTYALLLAALLVLWYYAKDDNGFKVARSTKHEAWTYAPTAVLVIVVALWRQVDYHCKALMPWAELRKGPVTASQSLLLDYTSPDQFRAFLKASRNGHWAVLASISAFAILKLMTIFATGLFLILPKNVDDTDGKRLRMLPATVFLLVAGFALLIALTLVVVFTGPGSVVPQDPTTIGSSAAILTRSNDLQWQLQKHGISVRTKTALAGFMFRSSAAPSASGSAHFKITMEGSELRTLKPSDQTSDKLNWWYPWTLSIPFLIATFVFPIIIIVVLEVLQHSSDKHNGLFTLSRDSTSAEYGHYIPALITLLVATFYNNLDYNTSLFSPFSVLKKGNALANRTLTTHLLGKLPPAALFSSIRSRHLGAALAIISAMLASFLTVLVSGLYTVSSNPTTTNITITRLDNFTPAWPNSVSSDSGAATTFSDLEHNPSKPFPAFTHDTLVFPKFSLNTTIDTSTITTPSTALLPALRANLKCTILPRTSYSIAALDFDASSPSAYVTVRADLPASCQLGGTNGNASFVVYQNAFDLPIDNSSIYAGQILDLRFGLHADVHGNAGDSHWDDVGDNPAVGCPSLAFTVGKFQLGESAESDVTTMICYQQVEQLTANVTFEDVSTTFNATVPPVVIPGSVGFVQNPKASVQEGKEVFDWRIQRDFEKVAAFSESDLTGTGFDRFFQAVVAGRDGIAPSGLIGEPNQQILLQKITLLYQRYMAMVMNDVMRTPVDEQTARRKRDAVSGALGNMQVSTTNVRLMQDQPSKTSMQVLLGLMVGCGGLALAFTQMRRVVPVNICTIAGRMSLLAGSELCFSRDLGVCECCGKPRTLPNEEEEAREEGRVVLPEGTEWMSEKRLEGLFRGMRMRCSLGWWRERHDRPRRFGIDAGPRADGGDDQEWELGERGGGVEGRGLGWAAFTKEDDMRMSGGLVAPMDQQAAPATTTTTTPTASNGDRGPAEQFRRFKSMRGPAEAAGRDGPGGLDVHAEEDEDDDDIADAAIRARRDSDARRVRWAPEHEVRFYDRDRRSEDALAGPSMYTGEPAEGHAATSFRRRTEDGLGGRFGGEA